MAGWSDDGRASPISKSSIYLYQLVGTCMVLVRSKHRIRAEMPTAPTAPT